MAAAIFCLPELLRNTSRMSMRAAGSEKRKDVIQRNGAKRLLRQRLKPSGCQTDKPPKGLSEKPSSAKGDEGTSKMKHGEIILRFLFPAHQDATKTVHPTVGTLDHPATRSFVGFVRQRFGFFRPRANVGGETELGQQRADSVVIITRIQTQPLLLLGGRRWAWNDEALQRRPCQFHVRSVRPVNGQTNRHTMPFSQPAALHPAFSPIRRVRAGFFSR